MEPGRRATGFVRPSSSAQPRGAGERREAQRYQGAPRHQQVSATKPLGPWVSKQAGKPN